MAYSTSSPGYLLKLLSIALYTCSMQQLIFNLYALTSQKGQQDQHDQQGQQVIEEKHARYNSNVKVSNMERPQAYPGACSQMSPTTWPELVAA